MERDQKNHPRMGEGNFVKREVFHNFIPSVHFMGIPHSCCISALDSTIQPLGDSNLEIHGVGMLTSQCHIILGYMFMPIRLI
jgi:hypothetical protein